MIHDMIAEQVAILWRSLTEAEKTVMLRLLEDLKAAQDYPKKKRRKLAEKAKRRALRAVEALDALEVT